MPAKKTTTKAKEVSKKEEPQEISSSKRIVEPDYGFDILGDEDINESLQAVLESYESRKKNYTVQFNRMSEVRAKMLPVRHFYLQWALGIYGIPESCLVEIIGAEGLGKTTLAFQLIGWAMDVGCPAYYIECENKQLQPGRVLRALHPNKDRAMKMLTRLRKSSVYSLDELEHEIDTIVDVMRGKKTLKGVSHVPKNVPILIVVDPWSKLMNLDEAAGHTDYGDNMSDKKKAKAKLAGTGSNMGHAKWAQAWCRRLPKLLSDNNIILVMVHHQNDEVDMSGGMGGLVLSKEITNLHNKTKLGGRAFNQNAAIQLILAKGGLAKTSSNDVKGRYITMRVDKNSFGPADRKIKYEIRTDHYEDTDTTLEPALCFDEDWANWMASNKYFGTTVSRKRYTCPQLDVEGVTYQKLYEAFDSNEDIKQELGERLGIEGYYQTVDKIVSEIDELNKLNEQDSEDIGESDGESGSESA